MYDNSKIAGRIKGLLSRYSGIISKNFSKAKQRVIKEIIYGIQATKDTKLSNISRSLNESIPLIKTEDRLSRNLDDIDFTEELNDRIISQGANKVLEDMVIALDLGDIRKKYAKDMEYLCGIHDGSEHEIGDGYWLCKAVAADIEHKQVIPLYCEAYSQEADGFKSENAQIFKCIDAIDKHIGNKGIWAIDRGGDRGALFDKFLSSESKKRFVIRLKERSLIYKEKAVSSCELAQWLPCNYKARIIKYEDGKEKNINIYYNAIPVRLPEHPNDKLFMVVVKGFGQRPMMLLTNCIVNLKIKESLWRIVEIYLTRWKCDESFRYIKQCYNLEDLRVRSYTSIRNMVVLVHAAAYFAAVYLGQNLKLKIMIERIFLVSKRFFGVPSFFNYAIADGLYNLLFPDKKGLTYIGKNRKKTNEFQLEFSFLENYA